MTEKLKSGEEAPGEDHLLDQNLKLLKLNISKCSSEGDYKSALKEIIGAEVAPDSITFQSIRLYMKTQFDTSLSPSEEAITNTLLFLKTVVELPAAPSATLLQSQDVLQTRDYNYLCSYDPIYYLILKPSLLDILHHFNSVIYPHCQHSISQLTSSDSNAVSTHCLLALVHKVIRTNLSILKRIVLSSHDEDNSLAVSLNAHLKTQASLLSELMSNSVFEIPLDIKCNIGVALCYITKIENENLDAFNNVFTPLPRDKLGKEFRFLRGISELIPFEVNRIAIMFGVLGVVDNLDPYFQERMKTMGIYILSIDHGTKESINLGSARVLEIWLDKLAHTTRSTMWSMAALYPEVEFFVFGNIISHIDAVKNCSRNMLRNLARIYDQMEDANSRGLVKGLLEKVLAKPFHVKWLGVSCVTVSTIKSICILEIDKDMPEKLLSSERTLKHAASDAYIALMSHHYHTLTDLSHWESIWIEPLFREQKSTSSESNWAQKRNILILILKSKKDGMVQAVLTFIVRRMNSDLSVCAESSLLGVEAIKIASELQIKLDLPSHHPIESEYFRGTVPRQVLHAWLWSGSTQVRLAGFALLVETQKTSQVIPFADLESLKILFKYNSVCQDSSFRQQFMSYYKKLLRRIKDSRGVLIRNKDSVNLRNYDEFLQWLWDCFTKEEGLFPGANFGRRCQALECLAELTAILDLKTLNIDTKATLYLHWLNDSYENNKIMAFRVLEKLEAPELEDPKIAERIFETTLALLASVKPPDSITGRYLGLYLIKKVPIGYPSWKMLTTAYDKLDQLYKNIQDSTLIAVASQTPMYGFFRFIRAVFCETKDYLEDIQRYRNFATKLIRLCLKYDDLLLPVLGSSAPEGFLPGLPDSEPENSQVVRSINAQMLLVCSWRSMKDICFLLTEMCTVLPLEGETEEYILTNDQVVVIGDHLLYLMKNLMHRGVFEQVYIGFRQLAQRLFKSPCRKFNELPETWLNSAMDEELVSSKCITRRSAGLPFIFQSLLAPVSSNEAYIAKYVNRLLQQDRETGSGLTRIHCMNVLRGLFKDANFSRAIVPYVPAGLELSFKGLKSSDWNERNAGLMLFGAVIRRTFGPKLNLMSAPTFFRKFPKMYDFLLNEIKKCCLTITQKDYVVTADFTYHVLILLSAFASNGVVEDGHFKLAEFIPYIHFCGSSRDSQVRAVAARALIPFLIHPDSKINFVICLLEKIAEKTQMSSNTVHGNLVQVHTILRTITKEEDISKVTEKFCFVFNESCWLWKSWCPMIYEVLAAICIEMGQTVKASHQILQRQYAVAFPFPLDRRCTIPGLPNADEKLARARVVFELHNDLTNNAVYDLITSCQMDPTSLEQLLIVLCERNYLYENLTDEDSVVLGRIIHTYLATKFEYMAQSTAEEQFLEYLSNVSSKVYADWVRWDSGHLNTFCDRLYGICSAGFGTLEAKKAALVILGKLIFETNADLKERHGPFCEILTLWCDSNSEIDLRYAVGSCIPIVPYDGWTNFTVFEKCKIWFCILTLTQDDELTVRDEVNSKLNQNGKTCDRKSVELFLDIFVETFLCVHELEGLILLIGLVLRDDFDIKMVEADDADEERLFDRSEMNYYNEPIMFTKLVVLALSKYLGRLRAHFHCARLTPELLGLFEFVTNSAVATESKENVTLRLLCARPDEVAESGLSRAFEDPTFERVLVQNITRQYILNAFS